MEIIYLSNNANLTKYSFFSCVFISVCGYHKRKRTEHTHYSDVIMSMMASQITSISSVYSTVCSGTQLRKHQSSASLAFVRGIHQEPVKFPAQRASNVENVFIWGRHHAWKDSEWSDSGSTYWPAVLDVPSRPSCIQHEGQLKTLLNYVWHLWAATDHFVYAPS